MATRSRGGGERFGPDISETEGEVIDVRPAEAEMISEPDFFLCSLMVLKDDHFLEVKDPLGIPK